MSILVGIFLLGGAFFTLTGAVGILRMPDFYSRLHPAGKSDTLGAALILTGLMIEYFRHNAAAVTSHVDPYDPTVVIKLFLTIVCLMITAPTATHSITKAAHLDGLKPWSADGAKAPKGREK